MRSLLRVFCVALLLGSLTFPSFAITWFDKDFNCPLDSEKNTFMVVGSYGSYIYSYPSKYQWLFFPQTDSPTYYTCKKCYLTTFMWDFDKLPKEKLADIKVALKDVRISKAFKKYTELPVTERLEIMEKVYRALGKDDAWWENFYRIKGYHYGGVGDSAKAVVARKKSLELVNKEVKSESSGSPKKLLLYISGAMKHFLDDDKGAIEDLEKAMATKYSEKNGKDEEMKQAEAGLNERIKEYLERIRSGNKAPKAEEKSGYEH